jgi:electron transport complex protein RnfG
MNNRRSILIAGMLLALSALLGTGLLSLTNNHAAPYIVENERLRLLASLNSVIPQHRYDNDLLTDTIELSDPKLLGLDEPVNIFRARMKGEKSAVAFRVRAPDGYSGPIDLLVGIYADGRLSGVRVISHKETPGLGDAIEIERNPWIMSFNGRSLRNPKDKGWKVKRDGGAFDQFTGATITPRAVVKAVHRALKFYDLHREKLFIQKHFKGELKE